MVAASLQMSWSLHNEIKDFYCATFDLPANYFVIWVRIKNRLTIGPCYSSLLFVLLNFISYNSQPCGYRFLDLSQLATAN